MDLAAFQIPVNAPGVLEFNHQRDSLWLLMQAVIVATPAAILWLGLSARWRDWTASMTGGRPIFAWIVFAAVFLTVWTAAVLPFAYLMEVVHRTAWGRPADEVEIWLANRGLALIGQILVAAILAGPLLWLQRQFAQSWWVIAALCVWLTVSAGLTVEQVWVRPMTAQIAALGDGPLKAKFDALAARCVDAPVPVFVGGVERGGTVVGAGPLTRMLIASGDIARASQSAEAEDEVILTFAHELSHYLFHDTWLALWVGGVLIGGTVLVTMILGRLAIAISRERLGFDDLRDPAAIPLVSMLLLANWTFLASPTLMAVQRHIELRADKFAIELTRDNASQARFFARDAEAHPERVQEYYWFFETIRATHPSNADRVRLAMTYKPWETGQGGVTEGICEPR